MADSGTMIPLSVFEIKLLIESNSKALRHIHMHNFVVNNYCNCNFVMANNNERLPFS